MPNSTKRFDDNEKSRQKIVVESIAPDGWHAEYGGIRNGSGGFEM